jgi:hypothetical protein
MGKLRTVSVGALNVSNEKESPKIYAELLKQAHALKKPINVRGDSHLILTSMKPETDEADAIIRGAFARYTEIDATNDWFDISSLTQADEDDIKSINIPDNLRPNFSSFFYRFFPKRHKFVFEARGYHGVISPRPVRDFLNTLLNAPELTNQFGTTSVNIVSTQRKISQLLEKPNLKRIYIQVNRPNPDDLGEAERKLKERLKRQNANKLVETLNASPGLGLKPDQETTQLAEIAAINGEVRVTHKEGDSPQKTESSMSYPRQEETRYDPKSRSDDAAFSDASEKILTPDTGNLDGLAST